MRNSSKKQAAGKCPRLYFLWHDEDIIFLKPSYRNTMLCIIRWVNENAKRKNQT